MQKEAESEREGDVDQDRAIAGVVDGFIEAMRTSPTRRSTPCKRNSS